MKFSHLDKSQSSPSMVDVSEKAISNRSATAESVVLLTKEVMQTLTAKEWNSKKGPILDTAIIAGTMAAKKTSELIPFCHQINLNSVNIEIKPIDDERLKIVATVKVADQTGVEMEALTACSVAALTIYDMCKSASKAIVIEQTKLIEKTGGKSDFQQTN